LNATPRAASLCCSTGRPARCGHCSSSARRWPGLSCGHSRR
jgi:hypothetical protein